MESKDIAQPRFVIIEDGIGVAHGLKSSLLEMYPSSDIHTRGTTEKDTIASLCELFKGHIDMVFLNYDFGHSPNPTLKQLNGPAILQQCIKQGQIDLSGIFVMPTPCDERTKELESDYQKVGGIIEHRIPKYFMTHFTSDGDKTKQAQELIESLLLSKYGKSSGKYGRIDEDSIERGDEGG